MRLSTGVLLFSLVAFGRDASSDTGDWWCPQGWDWNSRTKIPVWIHPDLADYYLIHADGTYWTDAELQYEVEFVIERIMDGSTIGPATTLLRWIRRSGHSMGRPSGTCVRKRGGAMEPRHPSAIRPRPPLHQ